MTFNERLELVNSQVCSEKFPVKCTMLEFSTREKFAEEQQRKPRTIRLLLKDHVNSLITSIRGDAQRWKPPGGPGESHLLELIWHLRSDPSLETRGHIKRAGLKGTIDVGGGVLGQPVE